MGENIWALDDPTYVLPEHLEELRAEHPQINWQSLDPCWAAADQRSWQRRVLDWLAVAAFRARR